MNERRRAFLGISAVLASPLHVFAQSTRRPRRIGYASLRAGPAPLDEAFLKGLRNLGYVIGRDISIDYRWGARNRWPDMYEIREFVDDGGLLSYGPDLRDMYRQAANYVARILKGAKPADLPVEQPSKLEMVINRNRANALGLAIPQSLLLRADEVVG